jgi:hypothetical protein
MSIRGLRSTESHCSHRFSVHQPLTSSTRRFTNCARRLKTAIRSPTSTGRALLLTEIAWASDLLGAGTEFETNIDDDTALPLLRSLQYKISNAKRRQLLIDNARLTDTRETR